MLTLCNLTELKTIIEQASNVYVFGIGKRLSLLTNLLDRINCKDKINGFIDNSLIKQNTIFTWENNDYIIKNIQDVRDSVDEKSLIIVTPEFYYNEICDQLQKDSTLRKCSIVCLTHVIGIESDLKSMTQKAYINTMGAKQIPKVIHYCWFGGKPIPEKYRCWMSSWRKYCPDYEIIEWNEKNYDISKNKYMKQAYDNGKWGFVPDYARLDIINEYGGIYLDTDVELVKCLDDLLYDKAYMGFQEDDLVNLGQGFGSVRDNELICEMMEVYDHINFIENDGKFNMLPSPYYQTDVLKRHGLQLNGNQQNLNGTVIYPEKMLCAKSIKTMVVNKLEYTHSIHHFDGSWADEDSKSYNKRLGKELSGYHIWKR